METIEKIFGETGKVFFPIITEIEAQNTEFKYEFLYEEAYLNLERTKYLEIKHARVYYQGRATIGRYVNCHKVKIVGKNGKSEIIAYYHPQVGDAGWVYMDLTIKKIPFFGSYNLKAVIRK